MYVANESAENVIDWVNLFIDCTKTLMKVRKG